MINNNAAEQMKRYAAIVALKGGHSDIEIARFLKDTRSFVIKVRKELESH